LYRFSWGKGYREVKTLRERAEKGFKGKKTRGCLRRRTSTKHRIGTNQRDLALKAMGRKGKRTLCWASAQEVVFLLEEATAVKVAWPQEMMANRELKGKWEGTNGPF